MIRLINLDIESQILNLEFCTSNIEFLISNLKCDFWAFVGITMININNINRINTVIKEREREREDSNILTEIS